MRTSHTQRIAVRIGFMVAALTVVGLDATGVLTLHDAAKSVPVFLGVALLWYLVVPRLVSRKNMCSACRGPMTTASPSNR